MMERHSWAIKISGWTKVRKKYKGGKDNAIAYKVYKVGEIKKCEHCGLMRGKHKSTGGALNWHSIMYFNDDREWLSSERLPYGCTGKQTNFLTKSDFEIC